MLLKINDFVQPREELRHMTGSARGEILMLSCLFTIDFSSGFCFFIVLCISLPQSREIMFPNNRIRIRSTLKHVNYYSMPLLIIAERMKSFIGFDYVKVFPEYD